MANVYDMVSGQFIEDAASPQFEMSSQCDAVNHEELSLQLQTIESTSDTKQIRLPADLAYQTFLLTE
jgi:hypothetical protein